MDPRPAPEPSTLRGRGQGSASASAIRRQPRPTGGGPGRGRETRPAGRGAGNASASSADIKGKSKGKGKGKARGKGAARSSSRGAGGRGGGGGEGDSYGTLGKLVSKATTPSRETGYKYLDEVKRWCKVPYYIPGTRYAVHLTIKHAPYIGKQSSWTRQGLIGLNALAFSVWGGSVKGVKRAVSCNISGVYPVCTWCILVE